MDRYGPCKSLKLGDFVDRGEYRRIGRDPINYCTDWCARSPILVPLLACLLRNGTGPRLQSRPLRMSVLTFVVQKKLDSTTVRRLGGARRILC